MNAKRRKEITQLSEQLQSLLERVEYLRDEEAEGFDNMPDSLKDSERGQQAEQAAEHLSMAADSLNETITSLDSAVE